MAEKVTVTIVRSRYHFGTMRDAKIWISNMKKGYPGIFAGVVEEIHPFDPAIYVLTKSDTATNVYGSFCWESKPRCMSTDIGSTKVPPSIRKIFTNVKKADGLAMPGRR